MKPDISMRLRAVEDELAIRALAARFTDCANERDFEGFADLWSARGIWKIGPPLPARAVGVDAIVHMLRKLLEPQIMLMQITQSGVVKIQGDAAVARFVERECGRTESTCYENLAIYDDVLVREADGRWRFVRRSYHYRFLDDRTSTGKVFPLTAQSTGARTEDAHNAGIRT